MMLRPKKAGEPELVIEERPLQTASFDDMMADWFALTYVLNNLNRSIGMQDAYPFMLSSPVVEKLRFIHEVILEHYRNEQTRQPATSEIESKIAI